MKRFSIANHSMAWLLVSAIVFPAGAFAGDLAVMDAGILIAWVSNLLYGLAGWEKRKFYIAFQITFFTFLLGRTVIQFLTGMKLTEACCQLDNFGGFRVHLGKNE